jgi:transcriptional regulator with XRE-family HTH domain
MADSTALGEFLRSRRSKLKPEDVGIMSYGARRVPGLRREELAQLAGVSATYYTRLEQGQSTGASEAVIDALARALSLTDDERAHLHDLARPTPAKPRRAARPAMARPGMVQLINAVADVPAVVLGVRNEVLAWNALGHLLLAGHLDFDAPAHPARRPNLTRMLFVDPLYRDMFVDWAEEATRVVAQLRLVAGRRTDDRELAELVGELTMKSAEFAALWSKHPVATCVSGVKRLAHPVVGALELSYEALLLADEPDRRVIMYNAEPGSASAAALRLLHYRMDNGRQAAEPEPSAADITH